MKFALTLLVVAAISGCALSASCTDSTWKQYKSKFNKFYPDPEEDKRHHDIFCESLKTVEEHNAQYEKGEVKFTIQVDQMSDLNQEEIAQWIRYELGA